MTRNKKTGNNEPKVFMYDAESHGCEGQPIVRLWEKTHNNEKNIIIKGKIW